MIEIHQNPASRKQWDIDFHTASSPFLEEMERQLQTTVSIFEEICPDKNTLMSNPTVNGAIDLVEKSKNHVKRSTIARNTDIPKTCYDFNSTATQAEAAQVLAKDTGKGWILKRRLQTYEDEQNAAVDENITKTEIIHKYAQETYKRLT